MNQLNEKFLEKKCFAFSKREALPPSYLCVQKIKANYPMILSIPGSKSITNRALVLAAMTHQPIELQDVLWAEDTYWGLKALHSLGFHLTFSDTENSLFLEPPQSHKFNSPTEIYLGKAGTLARFFPAVILNWKHKSLKKVTLRAHPQLEKRPLAPLFQAFEQLGARFSRAQMPLILEPSSLSGHCCISGSQSSQFLSGLLLAACGSSNTISIQRTENLVQPNYVSITLKMIEDFGGQIFANSDLTHFQCQPVPLTGKEKYSIEADASTACYFICLAVLHQLDVTISNLGHNTLQPDYELVSLLKNAGFALSHTEEQTKITRQDKFTFQFPPILDCHAFSDQALTLGVCALFSKEPVEIRGIGHIRQHESNRIHGFVQNLKKLGLRSEETKDGFIVYPMNHKYEEIEGFWETYDDHRFVMSGFLLASLCPKIKIKNPKCVEKTAPQFFELAQKLGFESIFL